MNRTVNLVMVVVAGAAMAQVPNQQEAAGKIKPPEVVTKFEPAYTDAARAAHAQGIVVLEFNVDVKGLPTEVKVVSPLGYGLSEQAVETVKQWRFMPGTMDGQPVSVLATVEVTFRLGWKYDAQAERERTTFNVALYGLKGVNPGKRAKAIQSLEQLVATSYGPGLYSYGLALRQGADLPQDLPRSTEYILSAADKKYPPALYDAGRMYLSGNGVPQDIAKGQKWIRDAAQKNMEAQLFLGGAYEAGIEGYVKNEKLAIDYFGKCASVGDPSCELRLGRLLLAGPKLSPSDYVRALAWIKLSAESGNAEAATLFAAEQPKLSPDQVKKLDEQKRKLVRR